MPLDAEITRTELAAYNDALQWSDDGSIALNTSGQLTILNPKYVREDIRNAYQLFEMSKLQLEELPMNDIFLSEPIDEVGSTLFSSTDVAVVKMKWSPLTSNGDSYLGILTNRQSVIILKNGKVLHDLTTSDFFETQAELDDHLVHCIGWLNNVNGSIDFITGTASGLIRSYTIKNDVITEEKTLEVSNNTIVEVKGHDGKIFAITSNNEIYQVMERNAFQLKEGDRFKIYDIYIKGETLLYTACNRLTQLSLSSKKSKTIQTGLLSSTKIIPSENDLILVSDSKVVKVDSSLNTVMDDTLEPFLRKRLNKWNSDFDDFHTKNYTLKMFGVDHNFNGSILAVFYEIQNRQGFRYKISSENSFKIAFFPLANSFKKSGSTLAIYQGFKLTGNLPTLVDKQDSVLDLGVSLEEFLNSSVLKDPLIIEAQTQNLITGGQDDVIRERFAQLVVKYIENNNVKLQGETDEAVYYNLLKVAGKSPNIIPEQIKFHTGTFEQSFNFGDDFDIETLRSTTGHIWPRCSLTFLPIITPFTKVDPVTERRIIDIHRDTNSYGAFTRSLLLFNGICIYSGSHYITK